VGAHRAARYRAEARWDDRALGDGIEAASARRPGALAVADNARRLSYAALARAVGGAVAELEAAGMRRGEPVVLVTGNTVEGVVAYHALLRAGATVLLLDRRCGEADVHHAVRAAGGRAHAVVPAAEAGRLAGALRHGVLTLERLCVPTGAPHGRREPDRDRAAVVLFTSGTTGRPKGVAHSLNTLTAGANNMARITGAGDGTILFLVSPLASITGVMQVHLASDRHAALVLEDRFDPDASLDRVNAVGADLLGGAPVIAERLLRAAQRRNVRHVALRTLALGGAMLPRPLLEAATDGFGIEIARVYGSTEAPNFSGSLPGDDRERRLSDDGALMPGSEVRVGSRDHAQEGLVRGPGVCLGYVDDEDTTAAFEGGWLRTGDLVDVHDGRLTVVGRVKEVVNRNGLKVSLGAVDAALDGLPGALEHAAFGVPDDDTGERVVVAVRPEQGAVVTLEGVVSHMRAQGLSARMLPEELVVWDGPLPRTASGKVVRSRLVMESPAKPSERAARLGARPPQRRSP
jgi:acyl-CoA synthetase (AMP-forming)/AMP-acid ligase II